MTLDELLRRREEIDTQIALHRARAHGLITEDEPCHVPMSQNPPQEDPSSAKKFRPRRVPNFGDRRR